MRCGCFGAATGLYFEDYDMIKNVVNETHTTSTVGREDMTNLVDPKNAINYIPMYLVLLMLSPDYLIILAYLTLVWQL